MQDREARLKRIYEVIMQRQDEIECWDCLRKEGLVYPGNTQGVDGKCYKCGLEGKDIGRMRTVVSVGDCRIGDVLDWIEKQPSNAVESHIAMCVSYWQDKRKPIDEQKTDCIDFIYNLLPDARD